LQLQFCAGLGQEQIDQANLRMLEMQQLQEKIRESKEAFYAAEREIYMYQEEAASRISKELLEGTTTTLNDATMSGPDKA